MEVLRKYENLLDKIKGWYLVVFATFLLLSRMVCFVELVSNRLNGLCYLVGAAAGGILCVAELLLHYKRYMKKEYYLLAFFVLVCLISSFLFREYGLGDNVKTLMWTVLQLFLFTSILPYGDKKNEGSVKNGKIALCRMANSLIVVHFVAVTISVVQFFLQSGYIVADYNGTYDRRQGFCDERLFGVFTDPNYAAIASLLVIIFALYFLQKKKGKKIKRDWYIITIVVNMLYILLSGSRTAMVATSVVLPVYGYFIWRNMRLRQGGKWHLSGSLLSVGVLAVSVLYFAFSSTVFIAVADKTVELRPYIGLCPYEEQQEISLEREDTGEDISNNRTAIWSGALFLWKDHPVTGLSPKNMIPYALKNHPDSYIAKTGYQAHNGYVALLVGSGLLGVLPILILLVLFVRELLIFLKENRGREMEPGLLLCFAVMMTVGISAVFLLEIFFTVTITITSVLFWIFTGAAYWYLRAANGKRPETGKEN